jgi:arabinan endo-1,5-alpha-L-arabinosidase
MRTYKPATALAAVAALALLLGGGSAALAGSAATGAARSTNPAAPQAAAAQAQAAARAAKSQPYLFVHDPTMARENGTYYVFSTGDPAGTIGNGNIQIRTSRDLRDWTFTGTVFAQKPAWITSALGSIPNLWAPDISFFGGLWHLYYAGSSFGSNNSVIALATTPTLDPRSPRYHWTDDGLVFRSSSADDFNAIDPSLAAAPNGDKWLAFGSFWSGIKLIKLDPATGKPASSSPQVTSLAQQPAPDPLEGAGITYHDGFYYLFAAQGFCCRGIGSSYQVIAGRSADITGPYLDPNGTSMMNAGGMEVQGSDEGMIGPGSPFIFNGSRGPSLVYHYYDAWSDSAAWVQVRPLMWASGWPVLGPPQVPVPGQPRH